MLIHLTNPRYGVTGDFDIKRSSWAKHTLLHTKRPEEALQHNLSVCYGSDVSITSEMIEKTIDDEYNGYNRLPQLIAQARHEYGRSQDKGSHEGLKK